MKQGWRFFLKKYKIRTPKSIVQLSNCTLGPPNLGIGGRVSQNFLHLLVLYDRVTLGVWGPLRTPEAVTLLTSKWWSSFLQCALHFFFFFFYKFFVWTKVHFVEPLIAPVLDFVCPSSWVSNPEWISCLHSFLLACCDPEGHVWCDTCLFHQ